MTADKSLIDTGSIDAITRIPEVIKSITPHVKPLATWLTSTDPNATLPRESLVAVGKVFVGQTDEQIRAYLATDPKDPNKLDPKIMAKIVNDPQLVLNVLYNMPKKEIQDLLASNPATLKQIQQSLSDPKLLEAIAPTVTLSAFFNVKADQIGKLQTDVQAAFSKGIGDPKTLVQNLDNPAEIGEFFSMLPPEQIKKFITDIKTGTQAKLDQIGEESTWRWMFSPKAIDIKIKDEDLSDPAKVRTAITQELRRFQENKGLGGPIPESAKTELYDGIRKGIQSSIEESLEKLKKGEAKIPELTPEQISEHLLPLLERAKAGYAKDPKDPMNKMLLDMISEPADEKDPSKRKLLSVFHNLLTVDNLMKNKDALVESFIPEGVAQTLGQFRSLLQMLDKFIPGLGQMVTSFIDTAMPHLQEATKKLEEIQQQIPKPVQDPGAAAGAPN